MILQSHPPSLLLSTLLLLSFPALWLLFPTFISQTTPAETQTPPTQTPPTQTPPTHQTHNQPILSDDRDDLSLFRRALSSAASAHKHTRVTSQPKIAFLFLTNTDLYLAPLWERFFQNNTNLFNVYIHLDPMVQLEKPLSGTFRNRLVSAKPTSRGSPSLISAAKRLIAEALIDDSANEYFALLSQSCIPIHSFQFVYRSLVSDRHKRSFIEILSEEPQLWDRYVARGDDIMLPEVPFDEFRIGSQFFILRRKHARLVIRDRKLWKKFRLPCLPDMQDSCYPEEHYFPTLLNMRDPLGCSGFTLTRVNWSESVGGHPKLYGIEEVSSELVHELRRGNSTSHQYLFARKFDEDSLEPLMNIADDVIFVD